MFVQHWQRARTTHVSLKNAGISEIYSHEIVQYIRDHFTSLKSCEARKCTETLFSFLGTDGKRLSKTNNFVWIPGDSICSEKGESSG